MDDLCLFGIAIDDDDEIISTTSTSRTKCGRCRRPSNVCICHALPKDPVGLNNSRIIILQHPKESLRPLHTSIILETCIKPEFCYVFKGNRFPKSKYKYLHSLLSEDTVLVYPGAHATPLKDLKIQQKRTKNIVILDGTWHQAQTMYKRFEALHSLPMVKIDKKTKSEYVVRTQPNAQCMSTVECAASVLSHLEEDASIEEMMLKPLRTLCQFQLDHGEIIHEPKDSTL